MAVGITAILGTIGAALGGLIASLNPFDWILIGLILTSAAATVLMEGADVDPVALGGKSIAALAMVALLKVNLPTPVTLLVFVAFWVLTIPNILLATEQWGIDQYFNVWGVPILTVGYFMPFFAVFVYFLPMVWGWYKVVGVR